MIYNYKMKKSYLIAIVFVAGGCQMFSVRSQANPASAGPGGYIPPSDFMTAPCGDASEIITGDIVQRHPRMDRSDMFVYVNVMKVRYEECKHDIVYVDNYLKMLEVANWSGVYNNVLQNYQIWSPGELHRELLPDSITSIR